MKLIIDVSEKEFGVDIANHFQDFFGRIRAEIKERLISNDTLVCGNYELEIAEMFLKSFKNATLKQELKTGHWIKTELPSRDAHECSECGNLALIDEWGNEKLTDFCPNCGAKMESEE